MIQTLLKFSKNNAYKKQKRQQNLQQIFEEEPYSFQQRNNLNNNFSINNDRNNFGSSNFLSYNPYNSNIKVFICLIIYSFIYIKKIILINLAT